MAWVPPGGVVPAGGVAGRAAGGVGAAGAGAGGRGARIGDVINGSSVRGGGACTVPPHGTFSETFGVFVAGTAVFAWMREIVPLGAIRSSGK